MSRYEDWVTVAPGPDETPAGVAGALLALATDPQTQVRTIAGGTLFLVHPDVAEAYGPATSPPPAPRRKRRSTRKDPEA